MNKTDYRNNRPDHQPGFRREYERHKKRILMTAGVCGICGQPVNKSLKFPHPMSATVDHIIPVSRGGHPSDINNLQLAHMCCNRQKANKLMQETRFGKVYFNSPAGDTSGKNAAGNLIPPGERQRQIPGLPFTLDWTQYKYDDETDTSNASELFAQAEQLREQGLFITINGLVKM